MSRRVRIAELKARLSEYLRYARGGRTIIVLDRNTPIARIEPYVNPSQPLVIRPARGKTVFGKMKFGPPLKLDIDPVELLLEDRRSGR